MSDSNSKKDISRVRSELNSVRKELYEIKKSVSPMTAIVSGNYWTQTGMPWVSADGRKAVLTEWFWQPIRGQPRRVDTNELRQFSQTFWVFSCVKTIMDEITALDWDILPKDTHEYEEVTEAIDSVKEFLMHPNKNRDSFQDILRPFIKDILEIDAGCLVKVFDMGSYDFNQLEPKSGSPLLREKGQRNMLELYARDGASFLVETDKFGFYKGWWQYSYQIPAHPMWFNRDEICYMKAHSRSMSPYGYAVTQAVMDIIKSLHYSNLYNKKFFEENSLPDGLLALEDTSDVDMKGMMSSWVAEFKAQPHKLGLINKKATWIPFNQTHRELEFLETQSWYYKLIISSFGLTPSELGMTEDVNRATSATQAEVSKRKAIRPIIKLIEDAINEHIIPEFGFEGIEFQFIIDDPTEKSQRLANYEKELTLGLRTINEVREEQGEKPVQWGDIPNHLMQTTGQSTSTGQTAPNAAQEQQDLGEHKTEHEGEQRREEAKTESDGSTMDPYSMNNRPVGSFRSVSGLSITKFYGEGTNTITDDDIARLAIANQLPQGIDIKEFKRGILVEMEHIDSVRGDLDAIARITIDHLKEDPKYYSHTEKGTQDGQYYFEPGEVILISDHRTGEDYASSEQIMGEQTIAQLSRMMCPNCGRTQLSVINSATDQNFAVNDELKCGNCGGTFSNTELLDSQVLATLTDTIQQNNKTDPISTPDWSPKKYSLGRAFKSHELNLNFVQFSHVEYTRSLKTIENYAMTDSYKKLLGKYLADIGKGKVDKIIKVLIDSLREHRTLGQLTKEIAQITRDPIRAEAIARTESIRIINEGIRTEMKAMGEKSLMWLAAPSDSRTCEKCRENNGRTYRIETAKGKIPAHPNCRCRWV